MMDVVQYVGKYLKTPIAVSYNSDKVLTAALQNINVEGFATIILHLAKNSKTSMSQEQMLLSYQWLEHMAMYANQATTNPAFAKTFLQGFNRALEKQTYLTGNHLTIADVAAYHVLYPSIARLTVAEQESLLNVCRWFKHIQAQPRVCVNRPPLPLNTLTLSLLAPVVH